MPGKRKFTDQQIIDALIAKKGMVHFAADVVGCSHVTIYNRAKVSKAVANCLNHESGKVDDLAEMKLYDAIESGQQWAITFRLSTKAKHRGFSQKSEHEFTGKDGGPMELQHSGNVSHAPDLQSADVLFAESLSRRTTEISPEPGIHPNGESESLDNGRHSDNGNHS